MESKKINKKRKKKRNEMTIEDYEKQHNIKVKISLKYEDDNQQLEPNNIKSNYYIYQSNINNNKKYDEYKLKNNKKNINNISQKEIETDDYLHNSNNSLNIVFHTKESASTNNSSFDENKNNNNEKNVYKKTNDVNENKNIKKNNYNNNYVNNQKDYYLYNKNNVNNNFNYNYFVNNKLNENFFIKNNNYIFNMNLYKLNNMISNNFYVHLDKIKTNKIKLNHVEKEIKALEKKTPFDIFLNEQSNILIKYINQKNKILINNNHINLENKNENKEKDSPDHPYFYTNHSEETQIKNILYLIEGLFREENIKQDFTLLIMLNRDGYASLTQLEKHPQLSNCKISESHLKTVFSEHRENEITETVETFDNILIRNKNWVKIKKEIDNIDNIEKIKEKTLDNMNNFKENEMKKLLDKKRNFLNIQGDILYQYQVNNCNIQQKINELRFNYNNMYINTYNNNFNNIFNIYNNNNIYSNFYNSNKRF